MSYVKVKNWETLSDEIWTLAEKQARRSTLHTFKTGAVIFDDGLNIVSRGTSHHPETSPHTKHAEVHALEDLPPNTTGNLNILVVTLGKNGNFAYSSCPCVKCAFRLFSKGIRYVFYAERKVHDTEFFLNMEFARELTERSESRAVSLRRVIYAREMRIK